VSFCAITQHEVVSNIQLEMSYAPANYFLDNLSIMILKIKYVLYGVMTDGNRLNYMRARYYSAEIRRFVNQDILLGNVADGQSLNRFAYVKGQVTSRIDPLGLIDWGVFGLGGRITNESSKGILAIKWESPVEMWIVQPGETTSFFTDVDFVITLREKGHNGYIDMMKIKGVSHTIFHNYPYLWSSKGTIFSIPPVKITHEAPKKVLDQWYLILRYIARYYPSILEELYALNYSECKPIPVIRQEFWDGTTPLPNYIPLNWIISPSLSDAQLYAYPFQK
jgi:RHS repeat-associated protein